MPLAMAAGRLTARTDADLIQASKRGDLSAFEEIYAAHAGRMKSVAFHMLADRADAEDAVQEAFLKIYSQNPQVAELHQCHRPALQRA